MPERLRRSVPGFILVAILAGGAARAQQPTSQPTTQATTADPQRLSDLIGLIEGQNSPAARRTGVRELLRQNWPQTPQRLVAILSGNNGPAKSAVALELAGLPELLNTAYIEPLLGMLADSQADVRQAAVAALAAYRDQGVVPRLRERMRDESQPMSARLAAVAALGGMTQQAAVAVLMEALDEPGSALAEPALRALERATALSFQGDVAAARQWWQSVRGATPAQWQQLQIERLMRQNRETADSLRRAEARLVAALRDGYLRAPDAEHSALLQSFLSDTSAVVRRLGLELARSHLAEGKTLLPETISFVRGLLKDSRAAVRAAAVRTAANLRDAADADRFLEALKSERHGQVRLALINGLGYVGSDAAAQPLVQLLEQADGAASLEAVTSLGRLAERGALEASSAEAVGSAMLNKYRAVAREQTAIRERLLWGLGRLSHLRFGAVFVEALDAGEAVPVRHAAARGIGVLAHALTQNGGTTAALASAPAGEGSPTPLLDRTALADALAAAASDAEVSVRKLVVEALGQLAEGDAHLQALWGRLAAAQESDETIRSAAWAGIVRVLSARSTDEIVRWTERLPDNGELKARRALELLQIAERKTATNPAARGELGAVRARIAGQRAALDQPDEAVRNYLQALQDLQAAASPKITAIAVELLRFTLSHGGYDERVAAALLAVRPALDGGALWEGVRADLEGRLTESGAAEAIGMLTALQQHPPTSMPAAVAQALAQMLERARGLLAKHDADQINAALAKLRAKADDQTARDAIAQLGRRGAAALRDALKSAVSTEQADPAFERLLHDLLKAALPTWLGFPANAAPAEKLKALETINA